MRASFAVVIALVAGCGKKAEEAKPKAVALPRAEAGTPLTDARWPPAIVWIGPTGALELTYTRDATKRELVGARTPAADALAVKKAISGDAAATAQAMKKARASGRDQPPPPEETAQDGDRVEGQYKMRRDTTDPELARQQAIEQARQAGILGANDARGVAPGRLAGARGQPIHDLDTDTPIIAAAPEAPAAVVARVVVQIGGMIAVSTGDTQAVMEIGFSPATDHEHHGAHWLELLGDKSGVTLVDPAAGKVTAVPWKAGALDPAALATLLGTAAVNVDVLAGAGMTAQQLVDVLATLHRQHHDTAFSLGETTADPGQRLAQIAAAQRAARIADEVRIGEPNVLGELDKSVIREHVRGVIDKLWTCYDDARVKHPGIRGTVSTQFFITPNGDVTSSTGAGVDPDVANCVAGVIKAIKFPEPAGGGGVEVNYPFTFASPD